MTDTIQTGGDAAATLKSFIQRIERLEEGKTAIAEDLREVYAEAKGEGFDTKVLRKVVAIRKRDGREQRREEALLQVYRAALEEGSWTGTGPGRAETPEPRIVAGEMVGGHLHPGALGFGVIEEDEIT